MNDKLAKIFRRKIFHNLEVGTDDAKRTIRGFFDFRYFDREVKGRIMRTSSPSFLCVLEETKGLAKDDEVRFQGQPFYISTIEPDADGAAMIQLRETYEEQRRTPQTKEQPKEEFLASLKRKPGSED